MMAAAHRGKTQNKGVEKAPETIAKMSAGMKRRWADPAYRTRMITKHTGRRHSPEALERIQKANREILSRPSVREKLRKALLGRECRPETRAKIAAAQRGEKAHNWKGGASPEATRIRMSAEYATWRTAVFTRDDYTCRTCGTRGGRLNADHIKPFARYPELRFDVRNGRTLCVPCHRKTPTFGSRR